MLHMLILAGAAKPEIESEKATKFSHSINTLHRSLTAISRSCFDARIIKTEVALGWRISAEVFTFDISLAELIVLIKSYLVLL